MTLHAEVALHRGEFSLDVALTVGDETVAVIGPNGAGKSSLLHAVAGLVDVHRGVIRLGDETLLDTAAGIDVLPPQRRVGMVFQDRLLFPHLSAIDNVAYGLRVQGAGSRAARQAAQQWLERVGAGARGAARPAQLSGGEAQRVALARALATTPRVLLLDEPLAALDVAAGHDIRRLLRHHLQAFTGPSLVVTHDPVDAAALADRILVLENGRVTHDGTIADITRHPRSVWAARLAGVNLFRGVVRHGVLAVAGGGELVVADASDGEVFATVAPSAVALFRTRPDGTPRNVWAARIDGADAQGERVRVHLRGSPDITAEVTPAAAAALDVAGSPEVWVAVKATEIRTYPA